MKDFILVLIRHGLALLGGFIASHGIDIGVDSTTDIFIGLMLVLIPIIWSTAAKWLHLDEQLADGITKNQQLRVLLGAIASQAVTALSAYFTVDANKPELLGLAMTNAALSKAGVHQIIALGGNPVKVLALFGCMLLMSSCAGWTKFMASPTGKFTVALTKIGLDVAMERNQISPGNIVQVNKALAVVTDPSNQANDMVYKLEEIGLDTAVANGLVKDGDVLTIKSKDTAVIQSEVAVPVTLTPSAKNPAKQPVNPVTPAVSMREPACLRIPNYGTQVAAVLSTY